MSEGSPGKVAQEHIVALDSLCQELIAYTRHERPGGWGTIVEPTGPGTRVHEAVERLQDCYRHSALPPDAYKSWQLLRRHSGDEICDTEDRQAYDHACDLLTWAEAEILRLTRAVRELPTAGQLSAKDQFRFELSGDIYFVAGFGEEGHVKRLKGMDQILRLIARPREPVPMLELLEVAGDPRILNDQHSQQCVMDGETRDSVKTTHAGLLRDLERARKDQDHAAIDRLSAEVEQLEAWARKSLGLGGRERDMNNRIPKWRSKIHGTIQTAVDNLREKANVRRVADHLQISIHAEEAAFIYRPDGDVPHWHV